MAGGKGQAAGAMRREDMLAAIDWKWPPAGPALLDRAVNIFLRSVLDKFGLPGQQGYVKLLLAEAGAICSSYFTRCRHDSKSVHMH